MSTAISGPLSAGQVARFADEGYLIVPGLYAAGEMLRWKTLLQEALAREPESPSGVRVWNPQNLPPFLLERMGDDHITPVLRQIIGPNVEFLSAKAVFKNGKTNFPSPMHQDWYYWEGAIKISVWIALDDATQENGCLIFVPGTQEKVLPKESVRDEKGFEQRVSEEAIAGKRRVTIAAKRGDVVVFSDLLVHGSHANTSGADRWSVISTYRDAGIKDNSSLNESLWEQPMLVAGESINGGMKNQQ